VDPNRRRTLFVAARMGLFLFVWALLLFQLNDVPPGFQHDQTFTSVDALDVLRGHFPIYFPANFGREPLFMYTVAGAYGVTGQHFVWSLRFTSVLWGMLGLAATLVLARRYLSEAGALVAAALMGTSFWYLMAARLGLEPIALLPLAMVFLYLLDRALAEVRRAYFVAAGAAGGLAIYTYLAARTLYLLLPALFLYEGIAWIIRRRQARGREREQSRRLTGLLLAFAVMLAVSAPLMVYLFGHSATADGRVRELGGPLTSALRGDLGPLIANAFDTVRSVLWSGSQVLPYQYNIPGRAVLEPVLAFLFLIGLIAAVLRLRERRNYLLVSALLLGVAPNLLTGADALYMRAIYALPLLFILAARGVWIVGSLIGRALSRWRVAGQPRRLDWVPAVAGVLLVGLLIWHAAGSGTAYFIRWADAEPTQRIYNADFRAAAHYVETHPADGEVFIGTDRLLDLDSRTFGFYLSAPTGSDQPAPAEVNWFSLPESPALPTHGDATYLIPASAETPPSLRFVSDAGIEQFLLPGPNAQYALLRGFRVGADAVQRALDAWGMRPPDEPVTFGDALRLDGLGYRADPSSDTLITQWTVLAPWPRSARPGYLLPRPKLALSLVDGTGYKWTQADVITSLPALTWQPGQMQVEELPFTVPGDMPPGEYGVRLVLYDDEGGPLPMRTADGREAATPPVVGRLQVAAGSRGEPPAPPFPVEQTREGNDLLAVGSWESPDVLLAGVPANLHVSWQALRPLETRDLRFRFRATAADGRLLWEQDADPVSPLPDSWPAGQVYRLTHRLQPETSQAGADSVSLELCAETTGAAPSCALVGQPTVVSRSPVFELPAAPQYAAGARWDDALTLAGYDLAKAGQTVTVTLYWRSDATPAAPLKRFVHAVNAAGEIVAQADAFLESDGVPPVYWIPGEYVADRASLDIPAGAQVAELYVGLYDPQTGERLPAYASGGEPMPERRLAIDVEQALP
jgi:hypothetical protein